MCSHPSFLPPKLELGKGDVFLEVIFLRAFEEFGVGDKYWAADLGLTTWVGFAYSLLRLGPGKVGMGKGERRAGTRAEAAKGTSAERCPECLGPPHPGPTMRNYTCPTRCCNYLRLVFYPCEE